MGLLSGFQDGLIFASDLFFFHRGAYSFSPKKPCICDKCLSDSGCFYAHGSYRRWVKTMRDFALASVKVWRHRWLCLCCGRTMSTGPPDVLSHIPFCTLVVVALLWCYLDGGKGVHNTLPPELEHSVGAKTLSRYVKRAKALSLKTQQAIREVLIEQKDPRPWEDCFSSGLSPPASFLKRHQESSPAAKLWRALAMLIQGSQTLAVSPCLLMARAKEKSEQRLAPFLL
jgi:hypothetical protein